MPAARLVPLAVSLAVLAGCTSARVKTSSPATTHPAPSTSTTESSPDTTPAALPPTSLDLAMGPGQAHVTGHVTGPEGAVAGATVRVERLVGDGSLHADVATQADGSWRLDNIKGGRYRVRAWRKPDLALLEGVAVFLGAADTADVPLSVARYGPFLVTAAVAPDPPAVSAPANVAVQLDSGQVDDQGKVRVSPRAATPLTLTLSASGVAQLESPNPQVTDQRGRAVWRLRCLSAGPMPLVVQVPTPSPATTVPGPTVVPAASTTSTTGPAAVTTFPVTVSPCGGPALTKAPPAPRASPTTARR